MTEAHSQPTVVLVTDRLYTKTTRFLRKIQAQLHGDCQVTLAIVDGFPDGDNNVLSELNDISVIKGGIASLCTQILNGIQSGAASLSIVALNESAVLPCIAIRKVLGISYHPGYLNACDKRSCRHFVQLAGIEPKIGHFGVVPGESIPEDLYFEANRYVVKPVFGNSSCNVCVFEDWHSASEYATSYNDVFDWVPSDVLEILGHAMTDSRSRIIEEHIDGTEFSVDGYKLDNFVSAIVHHKLCVVQEQFIGDGPTISPPLGIDGIGTGWNCLSNSEAEIIEFAKQILKAIGFESGVFHIEGRERASDKKLFLIEVNPRAPGGSLWKSALLRTGYDLEEIDAQIQIGLPIAMTSKAMASHVLHYPFYARVPGVLIDWGSLCLESTCQELNASIDFVAKIDDVFEPIDLNEEPYLAFLVTGANSMSGILRKVDQVLALQAPNLG